jgi:alpha-beta hydrolase superfamily lysophospholipase
MNGRRLCSVLLLLVTAGLWGCGNLQIAHASGTVEADDGYPLRAYRLFEWRNGAKAHPEPRGVLYYVQGSESHSVLDATGQFAGAAAMGLDVVMMERRGVDDRGQVDEAVASRFATKQRRVTDHLSVIAEDLKLRDPGAPAILFGASEGGDVAAEVAVREPRITHLVLLGSGGGWSQADELRELVRRKPGAYGISTSEKLEAALVEIRRTPDSDTLWLGHPHRRWSSFMFDAPIDDLLALRIPILLLHGSADSNVPVESARAARDAFAKAGKHNLTYREYADTDHQFQHVPTRRQSLPLIEIDTVEWLASTGVLNQADADIFVKRVHRSHPEWFKSASKAAP